MYLDFYGLKEKPFSLTPDPQFLYLSESHRTAIDSLLYGIQQREGFMVVTGDIGTGKTTICRSLLEKLDHKVKTAVIFNSFLTEGELLRAILKDLGFTSIGRTKAERIEALNQYLLNQLSQGNHVVLIVDEAQNLSIPVLEQIRMLSNLETTKEKMLQIILFGQIELNQKLRSPKLKQLNQRIVIRHHIFPLSREETESYIYQRLTVAGSQGGVTFSKAAMDEIYQFSKGIPRLINLICDRSLIGGYVEDTSRIEKRVVLKAKKELILEEPTRPVFDSALLLKFLSPLGMLLLTVLVFLIVGMIMLRGEWHTSFNGVRHFIQKHFEKGYFQISGSMPMSSSATPTDNKKEQDLEQKGTVPESVTIALEGSK